MCGDSLALEMVNKAGGEQVVLVLVGSRIHGLWGSLSVQKCAFELDGTKSAPGYSAGDVFSCSLNTGA